MTYKDLKEDIETIAYYAISKKESLDSAKRMNKAWETDKQEYYWEYSNSPFVYPDDVDAMVEDEHTKYIQKEYDYCRDANKADMKLKPYIQKYGQDTINTIILNSHLFGTGGMTHEDVEEYLFPVFDENKEIDPAELNDILNERYDYYMVEVCGYGEDEDIGRDETNKKQLIEDVLNELPLRELIGVHNEYCSAISDHTYIDDMCQLDEYFPSTSPTEIIRTAQYGDFNIDQPYFYFDGYGNLQSFTSEYDKNCPIYIPELATYIVENEEDLGCEFIGEKLEEFEEMEIE